MSGMVDLAYTKADTDKYSNDAPVPCDGGPKYPWGLAIRLEQRELDKLGMRDLPGVGQEVHMMCVGVITGINQDRNIDGKNNTCVAIQIQGLSIVQETKHPGEGNENMASENREQSKMTNVMSNGYRGR